MKLGTIVQHRDGSLGVVISFPTDTSVEVQWVVDTVTKGYEETSTEQLSYHPQYIKEVDEVEG